MPSATSSSARSARFTANLQRQYAYLREQNPSAALAVRERIVQAASRLSAFPLSGRGGRLPDTRELVVPDLPYLIIYRVRGEDVIIANLFHTSRKWPWAGQ